MSFEKIKKNICNIVGVCSKCGKPLSGKVVQLNDGFYYHAKCAERKYAEEWGVKKPR